MFTKEVIFMNHQGSGEGQLRNTVMKGVHIRPLCFVSVVLKDGFLDKHHLGTS